MRALVLLLLVAAPAFGAGTWERFDLPDKSAYWEVDRASITPTADDHRRLLARITLSGIQKDSAGTYWDHTILVAEVDCAQRAWRATDIVSYLRAERVAAVPPTGKWLQAPAGSPIYVSACGS